MGEAPEVKRPGSTSWLLVITYMAFVVIGLVACGVRLWLPSGPSTLTIYRSLQLVALGQFVCLGAVLGHARPAHRNGDSGDDAGLMPMFLFSQVIVVLHIFVTIWPQAWHVRRGLAFFVSYPMALPSVSAVVLGYTGVVLRTGRRRRSSPPAPPTNYVD